MEKKIYFYLDNWMINSLKCFLMVLWYRLKFMLIYVNKVVNFVC